MILVIGSSSYGNPLKRLDNVEYDHKILTRRPKEVSLVMFSGGEDVHPSLYGGTDPNGVCMTSIRRDLWEQSLFEICQKHSIKTTGICRGFQFLNVMAGGFMYQHITGHGGSLHDAYFPYNKAILKVTSTHHQLVGLPSKAIPIAWSSPSRSDVYIGPNGDISKESRMEIEAAVFPSINAMGVQYHPEMTMRDDPSRIHYVGMISDFMKTKIGEFTEKYGRRPQHGRNRKVGQS